MKHRSKNYKAAVEALAEKESYTIEEGIQKVKEVAKTKFDSSLELHIHLGINPSKTEQIARGSVQLPHGTGKDPRVIAFVGQEAQDAAKDAGADLIGDAEMIKAIKQTKKCDFDVAVATPDMMKSLGPIAKILGQKGLMPNPKTETVGPDVAVMIKALKGGKVTFKSDDSGNIHQIVGKVSFDNAKLNENTKAFLDAVKHARPEEAKGTFLQTVTLCTTMGPGVRIAL